MGFTKFAKPSVNPTLVLTAYADNDVIGGLLQFSLSGLTVNGAVLNSAILIDEDSQAEPFRLFLFDSAPTTILDDAAFAPTIADLQKLQTVIRFAAGDYVTVNSVNFAIKEDINNIVLTTNGILYGYLVANGGTPDYATTDALTILLTLVSEQ